MPRPSLNNYLRRSKIPPRPSLQQMANLYDALSKDARKQGFARFAGYTDEVLKILYSSAEGGIVPQLKQLLEKVVEKNELTRDDAKLRTSQALRDLDNPCQCAQYGPDTSVTVALYVLIRETCNNFRM